MEAVECGAAALGIILSYYARIVPLAELRHKCGISRDGSKAANILGVARSYGMEAKGLRLDLEAVSKLVCPYIVFWNFNHFLVVEGFSKKRVYLNDPATGPRTVSRTEFAEAFTGVVLVLEPGAEFRPGGQKPSILLSLWGRLQGSWGALTYCVLAGLLLVIPGLAMAAFLRVFVDDVLVQNREEWLRPLIIGILFTAVLNGFLTLLELQFLRRMKIKLSVGMSSRFLWHMLHLPVSFYDQRFAGEISSRFSLNDNLAGMLSGQLATTLISVVTVVFYAIVMLQYDVILTTIGIAFVIINIVALKFVSRRQIDANMQLMQEQGKVSGVAIAGLQSMETLKASGLESDFFARWAGYYAKSTNVQQALNLSNQSLNLLPSLLSGIASMLLLVIGSLRVMDGILSIGMLVAFQALMQKFMEPVNTLVGLASDLQVLEGDLNRLDDVLQNPLDPQLAYESGFTQNSKKSQLASRSKLQGYVELRNLTFGYNRLAPPLIENFNISLKPGQRVALVGGSGSGKSTVAKLICGLYEPWQGEIRFDGQPRSEISRTAIVTAIAFVEQDIVLFGGSIRDNLTLWDSTVSECDLIRACQHAAIHEVILAQPGGYDAVLLEGATNLSGGQRQRLEIARALVNNPSVLVMDEATSALDTETENIINHNLRQCGCTCIIVAHRLSTIRDCDEIIVLEQGKVVQRGTHEALNQVEGPYSHLIRSQGEALEEV
ncbi:NHLP family bacteriocin export ABC transporter peptidase/permease/ATPase subunit [Nostoc sp. UHCC 0251]|uniref:NHLP family bacteriocin export ABC transporter peptidase/permease/ATPase subunit n=1 Tax=Nostoc sp. UHCC 0251 TaxID=3110240 RepID=UPI002B21C582|nr:NHLP family bacteriocin export ABC transporter peptidase/permease/ATPase subunit [Nostoc sp. UHCC 0251]MEA5627192.1 NHLP family bacteriocin export ABC transporter peptidase/permease/ATPase subunit [Nostoc sp. UHCC 0251]